MTIEQLNEAIRFTSAGHDKGLIETLQTYLPEVVAIIEGLKSDAEYAEECREEAETAQYDAEQLMEELEKENGELKDENEALKKELEELRTKYIPVPF